MTIALDTPPQSGFADLHARLIDYSVRVGEFRSPADVLDELNAITKQSLPLFVMGAARFPMKSGDWESIQLGKSAFLHKDVPEGFWEDYTVLIRGKFRPMYFLATTSMTSYTWTEVRRMFEPIGVDQLKYELELKYGMRDGLCCPVGGRWVVIFWSRKELSRIVTQPLRVMIFAAASFASLRLDQLAGPDPQRIGSRTSLTPRETSVLRLVSSGAQTHAIAQELGLGEETVRSHLKKAQAKLGVRSRAHAVAEALRQHLHTLRFERLRFGCRTRLVVALAHYQPTSQAPRGLFDEKPRVCCAFHRPWRPAHWIDARAPGRPA